MTTEQVDRWAALDAAHADAEGGAARRRTEVIESMISAGTANISEIARRLGVERQTIYNWRKQGEK